MPKPVVFLAALNGEWVPGRVAGYLARHLSDEFEIVGMAGPHEPPPLGCVDVAVFPHFADLRMMGLLRPDTRIVVTVYDHFLWRWTRKQVDQLRESLAFCDALLTTNALIASDMRAYVQLPAYVDTCQNGVDADLFSPGAPAVPRKGDKFVVGWSGTDGPTKNLELVRAIGTVPGVELRIQDHSKAPRPFLAMPDWYRGLDLFACMSSSEGTPNPVLEAAACGVPFLSTDVGNVRELYESAPAGGPRPGIIVPQETKLVIDAVQWLATDRRILPPMGLAGRKAVLAKWTWAARVEPFRKAIRAVIEKPVNKMRLTRRIRVI